MSAKVYGVFGTAKNTGKTTVTTALIKALAEKDISVGVTSIGYDGEDLDHVTGLPKPRYYGYKGQIVAVAERCMRIGKAKFEILEKTNLQTPLGHVVIAKVVVPGRIIVAGTSEGRGLEYLLKRMKELGVDIIFVDGALGRAASMTAVDALIMATGLARSNDLDFLYEDTCNIHRIFNLPQKVIFPEEIIGAHNITLLRQGGERKECSSASLLVSLHAEEIAFSFGKDVHTLLIPRGVTVKGMGRLIELIGDRLEGVSLVFNDPLKLLTAGRPKEVVQKITEIEYLGGKVEVSREIPLAAICINPFYPQYQDVNKKYKLIGINPESLYHKLMGSVDVPIVDVKYHGIKQLMEILDTRLSVYCGGEIT